MDKLQETYKNIIDGKKAELQAKKEIRETENEINRILCVQLVTKLSWLTEYGIVPKLEKENSIDVATHEKNNKRSLFYGGWHIAFEGWNIHIRPIKGLPEEILVTFIDDCRGVTYRYTNEEFVAYLANHISVHI